MSSAGYASRLSPYDRKGVCGLPESFDTSRSLSMKLDKLVQWIQEAQQQYQRYGSGGVVVLTGAGISTSAGIPDFRGPKGIWTLEQQQKKKNKKKSTNDTMESPAKKARLEHDDEDGDDNDESKSHSASDNNKKGRSRRSKSSTKNNNHVTTPRLQDWSHAKPTFTHVAITKLIQGCYSDKNDDTHKDQQQHPSYVRFCITQNVDGLHRRSGLSRTYHAVLHGCAFTEKCEMCHTEYFHDSDLGGMSFAKTGRLCTKLIRRKRPILTIEDDNDDDHDTFLPPSADDELTPCGGHLRDTLLDWQDELPEDDFDRATHECETADLAICLGTSLRIEPAGSLPTLAKRFVIVNLQETPKDSQAAMVLRARVDDVMKEILKRLGIDYDKWEKEPAPTIERIWTPPAEPEQER